MELKEQFETLQKELKQYLDKAAEQQKANGTITEELAKKIDAVQKQVDAIDIKLAERHAAAAPEKTLYETLSEHDELKKLIRDKSGSCVIHLDGKQVRQLYEQKTTVTETAVGVQTTGVLTIDRIPGITPEARQELTIRDLLTARPTNQLVVDFVKVNAAPALGSPQTEASDKAENAVTFTAVSNQVRTIATWIPASKQVLDDMTELMGYLQTALPYYVNKMEEIELLSGDNTGVHLYGLITQATSFNTALLTPASAGWNRIDVIGRAIQQITAAKELQPTFFVVHPTDWWAIRLTKDSYGRYILGNPQEPAGVGMPASGGIVSMPPKVFGLTPVVTTNIASGTFLVGSGSPIACEIRDRMGMTIEVATQHSDYFVKNLVAIRAEKRLCLVTKRPASFITGTFTTSP
jgi:HK97 family phage major capsid protein